jgi:peroxiredoxin
MRLDIAAPGEGKKAVDFTLADLSGNNLSLSSFFSKKAILLDFSTTWCPHCVNAIPMLKDIYARYKDKGLEVLGVYVNEPKQTVELFVKDKGITYPILLDENSSAANLYGVTGVPTFIMIDKDGIVRYKGHSLSEDMVKKVIR